MTREICRWTARRAGASITITGESVGGHEPIKLTNIDRIVAGTYGEGSNVVIAIDKDGNEYKLY